MVTDEQLIEYSQRGIIPGPGETEQQFLARAASCLQLRQQLEEKLGGAIPLRKDELAPKEILDEPLRRTEQLWGIRPDWIPMFFSNHRLLPWHGGCAWIFQIDLDSPPMALFQLRRAFAKEKSYLGLYDRNELIIHEMTHVGRMAFREPRFEELLAYHTSPSPFRRWAGPLFQSSTETVIFSLLLLVIAVVDLYALFTWGPSAFWQVMSLKAIPFGILCLGLLRLALRHRELTRCRQALQKVVAQPDHLLYRLSDEEIRRFASGEEVAIYAQKQQELRWRLLRKSYW